MLTFLLINVGVNLNDPVLDAVFHALATPPRRILLSYLARGPATVGELSAPLSISAPAISRHLKVLEQAGLIEREVQGTYRMCRLRPDGLTPAVEWIAHLTEFWVD